LLGEKEILEKLRRAVLMYDAEAAQGAAQEALTAGIPISRAMEEGLATGLREVGDKFDRMEVFLPQLFLAAEAMEAGVKVLEEEIAKKGLAVTMEGTAVIGTVQGDIHDIGKNIVGTFLRAAGLKVVDLGKDVPISRFIDLAEEVKADIIGASALITTTRIGQRELIEELKRRGVRDRYAVMVGGAPITREWAEEIGADGYAKDGLDAARVAETLLKERKRK